MTDALPCCIHLSVCLWIMDPQSRASKKNVSHGNAVQPQYIMHLTQRPYYQWGSLCKDPVGNRTTRRPPDHRKENDANCSGQNHLARHDERGKKTRQTEEEVGRQHQEKDRPGVSKVLEDSGEERKMEGTSCEVWCPNDSWVKGYLRWGEDFLQFKRLTLSDSISPFTITFCHKRTPQWLQRDHLLHAIKKIITCTCITKPIISLPFAYTVGAYSEVQRHKMMMNKWKGQRAFKKNKKNSLCCTAFPQLTRFVTLHGKICPVVWIL